MPGEQAATARTAKVIAGAPVDDIPGRPLDRHVIDLPGRQAGLADWKARWSDVHAHRKFLNVDVAATAPTSAPTRMLSATPPKGGGVTRGFDLQPTLLLHSTLSRRCNSPIRARTSALALAVCSGEGPNSPAAHRRTVCRLTPMVRASFALPQRTADQPA
jgi:hypothetical protein